MQQLDSFKHREERKEWGSIHDIIKNPEKYTPEEFEKAMNEYISSNSSATEGIVTPEDRALAPVVGRALNKTIDKVSPNFRNIKDTFRYSDGSKLGDTPEDIDNLRSDIDREMQSFFRINDLGNFKADMEKVKNYCNDHKISSLYKLVSPICNHFQSIYSTTIKIIKEAIAAENIINDYGQIDFELIITRELDIIDKYSEALVGNLPNIPIGPDGKRHYEIYFACNIALKAMTEIKQFVAENISKKDGKIGIDFCMAYARTFTATAKASCLKDVEKLSTTISKGCDMIATMLENAGTASESKQKVLSTAASKFSNASSRLKSFCSKFAN